MKKTHHILFVLVCLGSLPACSQEPPASLTQEAWQQDLDYLAKTLPKEHKNAFHYVNETVFLAAVDSMKALPGWQDKYRREVALMHLTALIGDGHTFVPWWEFGFQIFPVQLFVFGTDVRVIGAADPDLIGAKLQKIDNHDVKHVIRRVGRIISQGESPWWVKERLASYIQRAEILHALGITSELGMADFTLESESGEMVEAKLTASPADEADLIYPMGERIPLPPFIERPRDAKLASVWYLAIADGRAVFVNFGGYPGSGEMKRVGREVRDLIETNKSDKLIIDLRNNYGGDFTQGLDMIEQLKKSDTFDLMTKVYVLMGRKTFSAAMSNAAHFKTKMNATLVGEPTGARPVGYQETGGFNLPNSKIRVAVSTRLYKFLDQDTDGIPPDKRIDPAWSDYEPGKDRALEWILAQ